MSAANHADAERFDVAVIGGGCVGTAVAMFAARAGLRTALLERDDFGAGTTSASTELIHGGLQYLFRLKLGIVRQSNEYARRIHDSAAHLCRPVPIVVPAYRGGPIPQAAFRIFMALYERYNRRYKHAPPARRLSADEIVERVPGIRSNGLLGGVEYYEWWIDAARMCLANARYAAEQGADVRNHTNVANIEPTGDGGFRLEIEDRRTRQTGALHARVVINATGPWTDRICRMVGLADSRRIRPTRGAHVFVPKLGDVGLLVHFVDGRFGIIVPRGPLSMIGTTDDDYYGDLDSMQATEDEIGYLLDGARHVLPGADLDHVVDTKVGVRPTIYQYGKNEDKVSRNHRVEQLSDADMPGFFSIYGGKLATHTRMAEDVLAAVGEYLGRSIEAPADYRLPGAPQGELESLLAEVSAIAARSGCEEAAVESLMRRYGTRYDAVLRIVQERPELGENLCRCQRDGAPAQYVLAAEVEYGRQQEWVHTPADIGRRTGLGVGECRQNGCLDRAARLLEQTPDALLSR